MLRLFPGLLLFASTLAVAVPIDRPWNHDVIYFVLTDRFFDGDPANDTPVGCDPRLYDASQTDIGRYHGGDLRGLEIALKSGYFRTLGVTALWITPPVRNVWNSTFDLGGPKTGYHGYWAQDFLDIDPHLTSRRSLDGTREYADSRDGRLEHYRDFVALAHAQGIKVIQDVVCNHTGPTFYYDANGNGKFDTLEKDEWIQPYRREGFYTNTVWADFAAWSQRRTEPSGPMTVLGKKIALNGILGKFDAYGRKGMSGSSLGASDGEEVMCDFFSLRDLWTDPKGEHFDELVNDFVEIYAFYLETIGVDGLRIDTVKHVHRPFWDAFTERLRKRLGPEKAKRMLLFGEVYSGNPQTLGRYTFREDFATNKTPCLDSLLNFQCCDSVREYLRRKDGKFGSPKAIEKMIRDLAPESPHYNPTPGLDGITARQKAVNFVENHDGLNRFRVAGVSEQQNFLADAIALTLEGIPCLYYGTERDLEDTNGKIGKDSETGRLTFWPRGSTPKLTESPLSRLIKLRRDTPALREGRMASLWSDSPDGEDDNGIFAFARYVEKNGAIDTAQSVIVVVNADTTERATVVNGHTMPLVAPGGRPLIAASAKLERIFPSAERAEVEWREERPRVTLRIPPQSVAIYRAVAAP